MINRIRVPNLVPRERFPDHPADPWSTTAQRGGAQDACAEAFGVLFGSGTGVGLVKERAGVDPADNSREGMKILQLQAGACGALASV